MVADSAALEELDAFAVEADRSGLTASDASGPAGRGRFFSGASDSPVGLSPADPVGALQADLPALRPAELAVVLRAAAEFDQAFVPDAADVGTTFYGVRPGVPFQPRFGGESRARHLSGGAKELAPDGIASVRRDVDTVEDLREALHLGAGVRTAEVAALMGVS